MASFFEDYGHHEIPRNLMDLQLCLDGCDSTMIDELIELIEEGDCGDEGEVEVVKIKKSELDVLFLQTARLQNIDGYWIGDPKTTKHLKKYFKGEDMGDPMSIKQIADIKSKMDRQLLWNTLVALYIFEE